MPNTVKQQIEALMLTLFRHLEAAEKSLTNGDSQTAESDIFAARELIRKAQNSIVQQIAN